MKAKVVVAITGASGSIYAKNLLDKLKLLSDAIEKIGVVMTDNAKTVWEYELGNTDFNNYPFEFYKGKDFMAPFASGSANYSVMFVCPCSMGTMGRIANGLSDSLITRAADVMLKERRKLICMVRDTPYSLIHIRNMQTLTEAGGIICPLSPSFYSKPKNFDELAATVVDRALHLGGFDVKSFQWGEE